MTEPTPTRGPALPKPLHFRRRQRLAHANQFQAVYGARVRKARGPITVFSLPNGLSHSRLGLSVGRRVGPAVTRNTVKRRVREAFRLTQHELPRGFDWAVSIVKHTPLPAPHYADLLKFCCRELAREWARRTGTAPQPNHAAPPSP